MDPSTLLAQLRDAHAPEPISFWPLAPGWWLLIILSLILVSTSAYLIISAWRARKWKRQAKSRFNYVREEYSKSPSLEQIVEINKLLKQVFATVMNDRQFLQSHGDKWSTALLSVERKKLSILKKEEVNILSHGIYSSNNTQLDNAMLDRISLWIRYMK